MKTINVYAVRDNKMESFGKPFTMENNAVALRAFGDVIMNDKTNLMALHPADFSLYLIASFDEVSGKFSNVDCPSILATGSDFLNKPETKEN